MTRRTQQAEIDQYMQALLDRNYNFARNEVTGDLELNGKQVSDDRYAQLEYELISNGLLNERFAWVTVRTMAHLNRYHPIKRYLAGLKWDGQPRFDKLVTYFDNPDGLLPLYLRKWMIGTISKVINQTQNRVLIFDGPQKIGKSYFVKWLTTGIGGYHVEGPMDVDSKDTLVRLTSNWIWELAEFGATARKADREALKNIITMRDAKFRRAYGRNDETRPMLASLFGTINNTEAGFLDDPSGSRRFLVNYIAGINRAYAEDIDVNQLWAELYTAFMMGETYELSDDEFRISEENNLKYTIEDPFELYIQSLFDVMPGNNFIFTTTADITSAVAEKMGKSSSPKAFQMALAAALHKLGLTKGQQGTQRGWFGIKLK